MKKLRDQAINDLQSAASSFGAAATAATNAKARLTELQSHDAQQNSLASFKATMDAVNRRCTRFVRRRPARDR